MPRIKPGAKEPVVVMTHATRPTGVVTTLLVKPRSRQPMTPVVSVRAAAQRGLVGDCHAHPLGPRQVLVVRQEDLDDIGVTAAQVRANIAVSNLPPDGLASGRVLGIGKARIRITHECEVCKVLRQYVDPGVFRHLPGRRGALGVILTAGEVEQGDEVSVSATALYPVVPEGVYERVAWVIKRIPSGQVLTYDVLLRLVGAKSAFFRVLPTYLKRAQAQGLPVHRVLNSAGEVTHHLPGQAQQLEGEGIALAGGRCADATKLWVGQDLYVRRASA